MKSFIYILFTVLLLATSCSEEWLEPDPKSFFSPENTFIDAAGLEAIVVTLNRGYRADYMQIEDTNILWEWDYSDFAVNGAPPANTPHNLELQMTPSSTTDRVDEHWELAYGQIRDANLLITRLEDVDLSEEKRNELLAKGYFARAYWYYKLVHQFGDVPFILEEINSPRLDFYSHSRETILQKITEDLEFAVQWLPEDVQPGDVNNAAGSYLLTKCYLSIREFDNAIAEASKVIDGGKYALMTSRFGTTEPEFSTFSFLDQNAYDVMWDLHQKNNKSLPENTEAILVVQNQHQTVGNVGDDGSGLMRNTSPVWWQARDPDGVRGCTDQDYQTGFNMIQQIGRGVGRVVPSQYFRDMRLEDPNDLRYSYNNWFGMERYIYNSTASDYYGQPFDPASVTDIRQWYPFPYNKFIYIDEGDKTRPDRASTDMYVFRLAGLYLLRAEAYWWKNDIVNATADVNTVRERAQASQLASVDIDYIFDERARELYFETPRKTELTRVAYIMASLGRDGYTLENMTSNNWFYDRVMSRNNFYRDEILQGANFYRMLPYHVYWPVKEAYIRSNSLGHINQTPGYPGAETNIAPLTDPTQQKP